MSLLLAFSVTVILCLLQLTLAVNKQLVSCVCRQVKASGL